MPIAVETLDRAHEEYRRAVEAMRDPNASPEAHKAAEEDVIAKRHALDDLLVKCEETRQDEARAEAIEARKKTAAILTAAEIKPQGGLPLDQIRAFANDRSMQRFACSVTPRESRTEYTVTTAGSGAYGSYLVPQTWADFVVTEEVAASGVLAAGPTIVHTAGGQQMNFPKLSTDIAAAAGTEGSAATQDTPIFTTVPLNQTRIDGYLVLSEEMLRDSAVDLEMYLGRIAGRALGAKMAAYLGDIDVGTGSSAPAAITVGVTSALTAAQQTAVTFDEIKQLYYSVLPQYRRNGKFIANSAETLRLAQARDDNGNYLWQPSNIASAPDLLFGKPWIEDSYFDASASGNIPVVFGDVAAAYLVRMVGDIDVSFSREAGFTSWTVYMRYGQWFDAATVDSIAVKGITLL